MLDARDLSLVGWLPWPSSRCQPAASYAMERYGRQATPDSSLLSIQSCWSLEKVPWLPHVSGKLPFSCSRLSLLQSARGMMGMLSLHWLGAPLG